MILTTDYADIHRSLWIRKIYEKRIVHKILWDKAYEYFANSKSIHVTLILLGDNHKHLTIKYLSAYSVVSEKLGFLWGDCEFRFNFDF